MIRRLAVAAVLLVGLARPCDADPLGLFSGALRELDGEEFLEDEPIWICVSDLPRPAFEHGAPWSAWALVGRDGAPPHARHAIDSDLHARRNPVEPDVRSVACRGFELTESFGFQDPTGRSPLLAGGSSGIPPGRWEIRPVRGDTSRVLARIRVLPPPGSERFVRDGLARAMRIRRDQPGRAAALYDAIDRRYPRTTYLSVIYMGQWEVRGHTRFAHDPGRWMEEIFAHFHDSCFGVIALDRWVRDLGEESARPTLRRLVGIYPDTPLSRAAQRYL